MFSFFKALANLENLNDRNIYSNIDNEAEKVKLKNGSEVSKYIVDATMKTLNGFQSKGPECDPMSVFFLVKKCKEPEHELMPFTIARLKAYGLLDKEGRVPEAIKNIVLSSVQEDTSCISGVKLVNPIELSSNSFLPRVGR